MDPQEPAADLPTPPESVLWAAATEASERVRRAVVMATDALAEHGIKASLVEGSAISAELSASDELVRRFATRASLAIAPGSVTAAERALVSAGWERALPQGDMPMLRTAVRHGRHLVFAMIDPSVPDERLHPAHPEAVRMRHERLSRWRMAVRSTLARHSSREDGIGRLVTESVEIGLVEQEGIDRSKGARDGSATPQSMHDDAELPDGGRDGTARGTVGS